MDNLTGVVRISPLKEMVHEISGIRISDKAALIIQDQINQFAEIIIKVASKNSIEEGRKTIMPVDAQNAFDYLMHPHTVIDEVKDDIEKCLEKLEQSKKQGIAELLGV